MKTSEIDSVQQALNNELEYHINNQQFDTMDFLDCIKKQVEILLLKSINNFYAFIIDHPLIKGVIASRRRLDKPEEIKDYKKNLEVVLQIFKDIIKVQNSLLKPRELDKLKCVRDLNKSYCYFLEQVVQFVSVANYITQSGQDKQQEAYFKLVTKKYPEMKKYINNALISFQTLNESKEREDYVKHFKDTVDYFEDCFGDILKLIDQIKEEDKERQTTPILETTPIAHRMAVEISPKEQERRAAILRANSLYEELCIDFMRDLEKQVPITAKHMYEEFVDVKFKNFVERYPMPIASDASEGYAKEVIFQLNKLIDYISKISQSSYVTMPFIEPIQKQG